MPSELVFSGGFLAAVSAATDDHKMVANPIRNAALCLKSELFCDNGRVVDTKLRTGELVNGGKFSGRFQTILPNGPQIGNWRRRRARKLRNCEGLWNFAFS